MQQKRESIVSLDMCFVMMGS